MNAAVKLETSAVNETVESYLQSDASVRAALFSGFLRALKQTAAEDREQARQWACLAVSPELDYTSAAALARYAVRPPAGRKTAPVRVAVLGGPTTLQLVQMLRLFLAGQGEDCEIYECEYGLFRQEILTPGSGLDEFAPQIVFIATGARDVARQPSLATDPAEIAGMVEAETGDWQRLWEICAERWGATVIQNLFEIQPWSAMGHYAVRHAASRENYLERLNRAFAEAAPAHVTLHDLPALTAQAGAREWFDPRFYLEAKMPCGPECLVEYAHSVSSLVRAIRGRSRKVLVLDLDNTVWGGVIGDVGVEGIQLGQGSGAGEAFLHFQTWAKTMRDRGVILAVCSKNDEHVARQPFEQRPDMVLKLSDISCFIANWRDKASNLREIAERLDLGTDSFVFVDDNPAERAVVRRFLPGTAVPELPEDPAGYVWAVSRHRYFETVSWTAEDRNRAQYYTQNARRKEMAAGAHDLERFLASLDMHALVEPVTPLNIERVTQLINKSNQFNLTTRRRTVADVGHIAADPNWTTLTVSLRDSLGDNGLISVIFLVREGQALSIDTWLMSCRVLQRGVEDIVLNRIVELAGAQGCTEVRGTYIPTERNGMVREHYAKLGFTAAGSDGESTLWTLEPSAYTPRKTHIQVELSA